MNTNASLRSALDADPLASLRMHGSAIADLAFGSLSKTALGASHRHLALLPPETLELDLSDPAQRQFGDYELLEMIGEGGMGVVYRARQTGLDREVAVKLLAAGPWASKEFVERFRREAQNAARMQHPNIVPIYEVGSAEELHFFSMRLIEGPSLAALIKRDGKLPALRAAQLLRTIAEAVDYAHRMGVLHLDLKPANVLIDENGLPHVADFGLARRLDNALAADNDEISGTPSYMAPEQAQLRTQKITPATDIWGLGTILYELVTGQPPFLGDSPQATLKLVLEGDVAMPSGTVAKIPRDLEAIILKCMQRNVALRYRNARALADDIGRFIENRAVQARPLNRAQRLWRWAERQPLIATLALLFMLSLLVGIAGVTSQWRRAENNAATASQRLWESRRGGALQLLREGKGFEALSPLISNIEEQEHATTPEASEIERREIGAILKQGIVLVNRMHLADAAKASPMATGLSPDGSRFAVALTDQTVHWFETATFRELGSVDLLGLPSSTDTPETPVLLRFVDEHRLRVTTDWQEYLPNPQESDTYLVDLDRAEVVPLPENGAALTSAAYSANGKYALLLRSQANPTFRRDQIGQLQFWQVQPWKPLSPLVEQNLFMENVLLSHDARYLLGLGTVQSSLVIGNPRTPANTQRIGLPPDMSIASWSESHDGEHFAFGDYMGRVYLFDTATKSLHQLPTPVGREVTWLAFSEDDAWVAAARQDGAAYAFDVASGNPLNAGQMQHDFELRHIAINRRQRLLIASGLGNATLWRLPQISETGIAATRILTSPTRAAGGPYSLAFCAKTGQIVTAETDGEIRLWQAPATPVLDALAARQIPGSLMFDGASVADVQYDQVRVVSIKSGVATPWIRMPQPLGFAELVDAGRTLVATSSAELYVLDAKTMQARYAPVNLGNSPMQLAASADGKTAVITFPMQAPAGFGVRIESYDLGSGKRQGEAVSMAGPLRQFELSPDGLRLLAVGPSQERTEVFDARTLHRIGTYPHDRSRPVMWATFHPDRDGLSLVTQNVDPRVPGGQLVSWNATTGKVLDTREIVGTLPVAVVMIGEKPLVAGREFDLFNPGAVDERKILPATRDEATAVLAVSHDKSLVARGFRYGVQLYAADSGAAISVPLRADLRATDLIAQVVFSPDDRQLLARTLGGRWVVWPIAADLRPAAVLREQSQLLTATANAPVLEEKPQGARQVEDDIFAWRPPQLRPQIAAARSIRGAPVPARSPDSSPLMLDLSDAYNTAPNASESQMRGLLTSMNALPLGVVRIDGVDYDVRGAAQLNNAIARSAGSADWEAVNGIHVPDLPIAAFHILVLPGLATQTSDETAKAQLRIHYKDGSSSLLPLRTGHELTGDPDEKQAEAFGWVRGDELRLLGYPRQEVINNPTLPNPYPARPIATIDLLSAPDGFTPVFFAVTVDPVIARAVSGIDSASRPISTPSQAH